MPKLNLGKGAECSVLLSKLHPREHVRSKFINTAANMRLEDRKLIRREEKLVVVLKHDVFAEQELYCVVRYALVTKEGPGSDFFPLDRTGTLFGKFCMKRKQQIKHKLVSPPPYQKFMGSQLVKCKCRYPQWKCCDKKTRVRTYCICSPGVIRCKDCYDIHIIDMS